MSLVNETPVLIGSIRRLVAEDGLFLVRNKEAQDRAEDGLPSRLTPGGLSFLRQLIEAADIKDEFNLLLNTTALKPEDVEKILGAADERCSAGSDETGFRVPDDEMADIIFG